MMKAFEGMDKMINEMAKDMANLESKSIKYEVLLETISSQLKDSGKYEILTTIIDKTLRDER